jgi:hypothetical protein
MGARDPATNPAFSTCSWKNRILRDISSQRLTC